jgi:pullulanase
MDWTTYPTSTKKLGCIVDETSILIRVWAPGCTQVDLAVYDHPDQVRRTLYAMIPDEHRVFEYTLDRSHLEKCYTFILDGQEEITDPYALGVTINSTKTVILDPDKLDPHGWREHVENYRSSCTTCLDAVIYEVHVKDFSVDPSSGVIHRGKYLGMVEAGTTCNGLTTGLDHLKELGVTHIHLMPIFDFLTVDERPENFYRDDNYNWGYDPEHYNVPEGSYATDANHFYRRIIELKQMIMTLQKEGFSVVMDVVYNHTYRGENAHFNRLAPGYYYRRWPDGNLSDGSGCGNELATERFMTQRLIMDSLEYWLDAFNMDGFRFDLMALIDIDTVHQLVDFLRGKRDDVFIYGEPWAGGESVLADSMRTTKGKQIDRSFAFLNDNFREAVKGDNNGEGRGFVQGHCDDLAGVQIGVAGSIYYDDGHIGFASDPKQSINYINSHDNLILYDKMKKVYPDAPEEFIDRLNRLAFTLLFLSQGVPLIHAGNEFLRGKNRHNNSYNAPISLNAMDWNKKKQNEAFFRFMKDLIHFRRSRLEFRLRSVDQIKRLLKFCDLSMENCNTIGYTIQHPKHVDQFLFIAVQAGEGERLITSRFLTDHLKRYYDVDMEHMCIDQIFDMEGLISPDNRENNLDPHGILLNGYDVGVFNLSEYCET